MSMSLVANIGSDDPGISGEDMGALAFSLAITATLCMTILAGFVCARVSRSHIWRDTGILIAITGGLKFAYGLWLDPLLLVAVTTVGTIAALAYGAWLGIRSLRKKAKLQIQS